MTRRLPRRRRHRAGGDRSGARPPRAAARRRARGAPVRRRRDPRPATRCRRRRSPLAATPTPCSRRGRRPEVGRRGGASRAGAASPPPRARRVREPAPARGAVDLLIVRELVGGLYYGGAACATTAPSSTRASTTRARSSGSRAARSSSRRRPRRAAALGRQGERARDVAPLAPRLTRSRADYPDVELRHGLVDTVAMRLVDRPRSFDVLVMENTFGDILSDVAAGRDRRSRPRRSGEPGRGAAGSSSRCTARLPTSRHRRANPAAMLRSLALALEHGLARPELARRLEVRSRLPRLDADRRRRRHRDNVRFRRRRPQSAVVAKRGRGEVSKAAISSSCWSARERSSSPSSRHSRSNGIHERVRTDGLGLEIDRELAPVRHERLQLPLGKRTGKSPTFTRSNGRCRRTMARPLTSKPRSCRAHAARSREEPQPKSGRSAGSSRPRASDG